MGIIQCAKMQFQGKICKFSVKIATKSLNFQFSIFKLNPQNAREARKNLQSLCKI